MAGDGGHRRAYRPGHSAEIFAAHGIEDCEPHLAGFFAAYADEVHANRHLRRAGDRCCPVSGRCLTALADRPNVVQTLVTGNIPAVAAAKVAAFDRTGVRRRGGWLRHRRQSPGDLVRRSLERAEAKYGHGFDAIVVGDTVHDVTAALANGATVLAVATGATTAEELAAAGAHHTLTDLSDVDAVVSLLAGGDQGRSCGGNPVHCRSGGR